MTPQGKIELNIVNIGSGNGLVPDIAIPRHN